MRGRRETVPLRGFKCLAALFLLLTATAPLAEATCSGATGCRPSQALVLQTHDNPPVSSAACPGCFQAFLNLTWMVSPDDNATGSLAYTIWINVPPCVGCTSSATGWISLPVSAPEDGASGSHWYRVPNNPGWIGANITYASGATGCTSYVTISCNQTAAINITTWNVTSLPSSTVPAFAIGSLPSCLVNVSMITPLYGGIGNNPTNSMGSAPSTGHDQCGYPRIRDPGGSQATITVPASLNVSALIDARTALSPDDPNTTTGNFSYRTFLAVNGQANDSASVDLGLDATDSDDGSGIRDRQIQFSGSNYPTPVAIYWRAENNDTHQWSNLTCAIIVQTARASDSGTCGILGTSLALVAPGTPTFPGINVTAFTTSSHLDPTLGLWLLAAVLLVFLAFWGLGVGGVAVSIILAGFSLPLAYSLNLLPLWWLVLIYIALATTVVSRSRLMHA